MEFDSTLKECPAVAQSKFWIQMAVMRIFGSALTTKIFWIVTLYSQQKSTYVSKECCGLLPNYTMLRHKRWNYYDRKFCREKPLGQYLKDTEWCNCVPCSIKYWSDHVSWPLHKCQVHINYLSGFNRFLIMVYIINWNYCFEPDPNYWVFHTITFLEMVLFLSSDLQRKMYDVV
jgi:hypothetical protein